MSERKPEKEQKPLKIVELNEWFAPFIDYDNTTFVIKKENLHSKRISLIIHPIGEFTLETIWDRTEDAKKYYYGKRTLVVLPFGEEVIDAKNFEEEEKKLESRLLTICILCDEEKFDQRKGKTPEESLLMALFGKFQPFPYSLEVLLPSGKVFSTQFDTSGEPFIEGLEWYEKGGNESIVLMIPEVENILEKIQMRIMPIAESQRLP